MIQATPFIIAIPLLCAALLSVAGGRLPRWAVDAVSILVALLDFLLCSSLVLATRQQPQVYWFGGWLPAHGVTPGISFFIDPAGAGLAAFTSLLMSASFVFSIRYFKEVKAHFHALMLVFLGAMCAFSLTGDLFNLFVWFELMTGAGIALCGYKVEEVGPLQGAMNFAVTNTIGAFLGLTGIILLYAHTGALNMAQVARVLDSGPGSGVVVVSFVFIACGFLVKAAVIPFHFWLADAHAVAPTPVCVLFSGVMVELGLYAVARIHGAVFSRVLASQAHLIHGVFLSMGVATAFLGGVMAFLQRHLKRLLAFSTISHMGLMVIGFSFLQGDGMSGTALYLVGHGLVKAALFLCVGVLLNRFGCVDEQELRGRGKRLVGLGMVFGALGLAGLPPFVQFRGVAAIEHAAEAAGEAWVGWVFVLAEALTAGAVFRVWGRVFHGWGIQEPPPGDQASGSREKPETQGSGSLVLMYLPAVFLLLLSLALTWVHPFVQSVLELGPRFQDHAAYGARVLQGQDFPPRAAATFPPLGEAAIHSVISFGLACILAAAGLRYRSREKQGWKSALSWIGRGLHSLHSGEIGDYVAWFTAGVAVYVGVMLWA